nr:hypothetical protein [Tanacetum cinerariifolium]
MKKIIKEQVKEQVKALVEVYESDKIILDTYRETVTLKRRRDDDADKDEEPSAGPDPGSKRRREGKEPESASAPIETATRSAGRSIQSWISDLAKRSNSCSSFNELMDTPLDFSNFLINRLKVDTLTLELIAGPTYELLKGSCKSLVELEYHLEEVYKATTDQLDWVNPEGASSRKYTTSVTKTKAADYGHIKWIEDLVPRTMWIEEPIGYDKHALYDGTLTDVRTALDDRLKGIWMQYLPQSIWRKSDKDRAVAMIQVIDKRLKTKRIMRSLERFIGGRLYEGDFRMLQRII